MNASYGTTSGFAPVNSQEMAAVNGGVGPNGNGCWSPGPQLPSGPFGPAPSPHPRPGPGPIGPNTGSGGGGGRGGGK